MRLAASSGDDVVAAKSTILQRLRGLPRMKRVMIIDDTSQDSNHVAAALRLLLGRDVEITQHRSMPVAIESLRRRHPDLIVLDDYLPPTDRAETSMRSIARFGYQGPVIIMSGIMTCERHRALMELRPLGVLDKDDINTVGLADMLVRLIPDGPKG